MIALTFSCLIENFLERQKLLELQKVVPNAKSYSKVAYHNRDRPNGGRFILKEQIIKYYGRVLNYI